MTYLGQASAFDEQLQGVRPVGDIEPIIQFTIRGNPVPQGNMKAFQPRKKVGEGVYVPVGGPRVTYKNPSELNAWRSAIASGASTAMGDRDLLQGPVGLIVTFVLPRGRGHYGVKGLLGSAPAYPVVRPDLDKLTRAVLDALSGVVYGADNQVVTIAVRKIYGETPGVRVGVTHPQDELLSFDWNV